MSISFNYLVLFVESHASSIFPCFALLLWFNAVLTKDQDIIQNSSALKNENLLKMYLPLGKTRCRNLALRHLFTKRPFRQNASLRLKTQDTALRSVFFFFKYSLECEGLEMHFWDVML